MGKKDFVSPGRFLAIGSALVATMLLAGRAGEKAEDTQAGNGAPKAQVESLAAVLEPRRRAVVAARISSQVMRIHKELGQAFAADEVLITFDDAVFRAAHQRASAQYRLAMAVLKSRERLSKDGSVSQIELEQARTEAEVAEANLRIAENELAHCSLRAPWPGRVAEIMVNEYESVAAGKPLLEIVDDRMLLAKALAPADWLSRLKVGQTATIRIAETGEPVAGRLSHIGAVVEPASATVRVYFEVDNADSRLKAGMRGAVDIPLASPEQ